LTQLRGACSNAAPGSEGTAGNSGGVWLGSGAVCEGAEDPDVAANTRGLELLSESTLVEGSDANGLMDRHGSGGAGAGGGKTYLTTGGGGSSLLSVGGALGAGGGYLSTLESVVESPMSEGTEEATALSVVHDSLNKDSPQAPSGPGEGAKEAAAKGVGGGKVLSQSGSPKSPASEAGEEEEGKHNKYCHFCQHVKLRASAMMACENKGCARRYCEHCLTTQLKVARARTHTHTHTQRHARTRARNHTHI
jgi:hypothetical protein